MSTYTDATLDFDSSHKPTLDISWDRKRPLLEVESLNKFYGDTQVLHDISLQIKPGEIIGLVGPNGAGKTTLMETLYGGQPFEAGLVRLFGEDVRQGLNHVIKQQLGVVPQSFSLPSLLRVEEIISLYQVLYTDALSVKQLLDIVALKAQRKMRFSRLSGGKKDVWCWHWHWPANPSFFCWMNPPAILTRKADAIFGGTLLRILVNLARAY